MANNPFPDSMFETFGHPMGPSAQELREEAEGAQRIDKVTFKKYNVKTYNLNDAEDVKHYEATMKILIEGVAKRTHVIFNQSKQFVPDKAVWLVNIEWGEFELQSSAIEPIPTANTVPITDAQREAQRALQGLETYGKDSPTR